MASHYLSKGSQEKEKLFFNGICTYCKKKPLKQGRRANGLRYRVCDDCHEQVSQAGNQTRIGMRKQG